jgi:hypothetical protein
MEPMNRFAKYIMDDEYSEALIFYNENMCDILPQLCRRFTVHPNMLNVESMGGEMFYHHVCSYRIQEAKRMFAEYTKGVGGFLKKFYASVGQAMLIVGEDARKELEQQFPEMRDIVDSIVKKEGDRAEASRYLNNIIID